MLRPPLPPELRDERWCPACARPLDESTSLDPWALCLACSAGHRFFVDPLHVEESAHAAAAVFGDLVGLDHDAVARFWLGDPRARPLLHPQLAEILRAIVEKRTAPTQLRAVHCLVCKAVMTEAPVTPRKSQGLRCANGHEWLLMSGALSNVTGIREAIIFSPECCRRALTSSTKGWLQGHPRLDPHLHESVRAVLRESEFSRDSA